MLQGNVGSCLTLSPSVNGNFKMLVDRGFPYQTRNREIYSRKHFVHSKGVKSQLPAAGNKVELFYPDIQHRINGQFRSMPVLALGVLRLRLKVRPDVIGCHWPTMATCLTSFGWRTVRKTLYPTQEVGC